MWHRRARPCLNDFLWGSLALERVDLVLLYLFRKMFCLVCRAISSPLCPGCIRRISFCTHTQIGANDENWDVNWGGRLPWTECGDPRGRAQGRVSLSR